MTRRICAVSSWPRRLSGARCGVASDNAIVGRQNRRPGQSPERQKLDGAPSPKESDDVVEQEEKETAAADHESEGRSQGAARAALRWDGGRALTVKFVAQNCARRQPVHREPFAKAADGRDARVVRRRASAAAIRRRRRRRPRRRGGSGWRRKRWAAAWAAWAAGMGGMGGMGGGGGMFPSPPNGPPRCRSIRSASSTARTIRIPPCTTRSSRSRNTRRTTS